MSWVTPITLRGKYVTLIPLAMEHCANLIKAAKDGELWKLWYATVPSPEGMADEIKHRFDSQTKGTMLPFTVIDNVTKLPIGMTTYMDITPINKRLEIGSRLANKSLFIKLWR